ncbi:MAG: AAA family ATPase, partial [bacterium]
MPAVLSWGRSVSDQQATIAEQMIYRELSRGRDLLAAVQRARQELLEHFREAAHQAWPLLRLYSDGRMHGPLVQPNQKVRPKPRQMVHTTLKNSQVKILETGFVGRRRQMQQSVQALKDSRDKVGALLHGAGGLGKSCLAGKLCERFSGHTLIIVHGKLNAITLQAGLKDAFIAANDAAGLEILAAPKEMPEKLAQLCATCFKEKNYLLVLDDFEQNLEGAAAGAPGPLLAETVPLLQTLLHYLPLTGKMTQLLITSRYEFALTENERDLVAGRLENVSLHSFQLAEQQKKARELSHLAQFLDSLFVEM